jgi:hypothetical protein
MGEQNRRVSLADVRLLKNGAAELGDDDTNDLLAGTGRKTSFKCGFGTSIWLMPLITPKSPRVLRGPR